ncbi:histidine phosphatase family protein [Microbacterium hominis]|uniref:Histidine phosphatase family protein n=1 Tax=Microbacterium hominis TaxID=162426 RepID=A0A7D4Q841_9MICO|nr:histidine phosphatase family protein [Microbacterium hominis]QKJ19559.1 histidine phosphatase family protein [Microbacterium hominis]
MTVLTLIRHGETDWNRDRRIQGSTDIPLNDTGRAQARAAAAALRDTLDLTQPVSVVASDLSRAAETAAIIAHELGLDAPALTPALRERSYGVAEGMDIAQFRAEYGETWARAVPGAETLPDLRARGLAALERAVADVRRQTAPAAASLIVVAHGGLIRELIAHASGGALPLAGERLQNGSAHTMLYERERLRLLSYAGVA